MARTRRQILGLSEDATEAEVAEADHRMAKEIIAKQEAIKASEDALKISGVAKQQTVKGKEEAVRMPEANPYPYLSEEEVKFAKAFRFSEDTVLEMFGGLRGYKLHELQRKEVRSKGHTVTPLPMQLSREALEQMERFGLTENQLAQVAVEDQIKQVQSLVDLEKARQRLEEFERLNR